MTSRMDDHFAQMLAPSMVPKGMVAFIPCEKFAGSKPGYYFKMGVKGLGYYYDRLPGGSKGDIGGDDDAHQRKRRREDEEDGEEEDAPESSSRATSTAAGKDSIEKMLEDAEALGVTALDQTSLQQLLVSFEKKINKNQKMRMKHGDEPLKFMDSELELHAELKELYVVAASPELYPVLVESGSVTSILGMITHENTDISIEAVGLLQELTDVDTIQEDDSAMVFIDTLLKNQGLELIVQNLSRLDEANDEDAQGVYNSMAIIENLIELKPEVAKLICEKTHILKFLLLRLKVKKFDANKLYCSEILSILLQSGEDNQKRVCNLQGMDGMEGLLQTIAQYRKKDPASMDEEECVENLFLCLCSALMPLENRSKFLECEGVELIVRCLKEQKHATIGALQVAKYATSESKECCEKFVEVGGLKYVFPILMGWGLPKIKNKSGAGSIREVEETVVSVICELITQLHDSDKHDAPARLLVKLLEKEGEKLDRCAELCGKYYKYLQSAEKAVEDMISELQDAEDEEELDDFCRDDNIYAQRLEGGLFTLQQLAVIITFACAKDSSSGPKNSTSTSSVNKVRTKLKSEGFSLESLLEVLQETVEQLAGEEEEKDGGEGQQREDTEDAKREEKRSVMAKWTTTLSALISVPQ